MARRYDDEDDWDDLEELEEEEQEPGILTTTRILVGMLVFVVLAIVVTRLVFWENPEYTVDIEVYGLVKKGIERSFNVNKHRDAELKVSLSEEGEGRLTIRLNGLELFSGNTGEYMSIFVPGAYFQDYNTIELIPSHDGYFSLDYAELVFKD